MTFTEAMAVLGLDAAERDPAVVRAAYLAKIRASHPDVNSRPSATGESARIIDAYATVAAGLSDHAAPPPPPPDPQTRPRTPSIDLGIDVIADDTIEVHAPADLTYALLVQASHEIGDVTFLDRSAAILQIVITFEGEPPCQMIFDLQGRAAHGTTEVFCTIESMEDRPAPPIDAVTRFVAEHLRQVAAAALT